MEKIKGVFFDLGWTLEDPESGDWFLTSLFRDYYPGIFDNRVNKKMYDGAFQKAFAILIKDHKMSTAEEEIRAFRNFFLSFMEEIGEPISHDRATELAENHTFDMGQYVVKDTAYETLEKLKEDGYKLGVISDTWPSCYKQMKLYRLDRYFDSCTYSCDLGVWKPDPLMFTTAIDSIGLPPDQCVYADDLTWNLEGGKKYGLRPVLSLNDGSEDTGRYPSIRKPMDIFKAIEYYESPENSAS